MPRHDRYMCLALRTLIQVRTMLTDFWIALVFPAALAVRAAVAEDLICGTEIAVEVFIINVFILWKKPSFALGREQVLSSAIPRSFIFLAMAGVL